MGSDVYLCYKKSTAKTHLLAYKPGEYFYNSVIPCFAFIEATNK